MADRILSTSDVLFRGDRVELYINGNTPLIYGPTIQEVRSAIDGAQIGAETFFGDELALQGVASLLNWYRVDVEITREQSVGELKANAAQAVDSNLASFWNVSVHEVRIPGTSLGDILGDVIPEVPTSTAASLVAIAVIVLVIVIVIK